MLSVSHRLIIILVMMYPSLSLGGERMEGGSTVPEVLDECMVLDTEIFLWYPPAISGKPPSAR